MQIAENEKWQKGDWEYTWNANGSLKSVKLPNGDLVQYEYDALGRRTKKLANGKIKRYLWDGNVLLHEWEYNADEQPRKIINKLGEISFDKPEPINNLITWIYETGSFVPSAKIVGNEAFSIINDYIGRPIQAYDNLGNLIWSCDYDIYGGLRNLKGDKSFIPFRQLGQYEDCETGLYYNRFRYYDPNSGTYISKDPIGLLGNNPNFYAYVFDSNTQVDILGLFAGTGLKWNNGRLGINDIDWRGQGKSINEALEQAFKNTGYNRSDFHITKWGYTIYGKSIPVEWKGPNGSEVNMDFSHYGFDKKGNWNTGPDAPHIGWQVGKGGNKKIGHILLDDVPAGRTKIKCN